MKYLPVTAIFLLAFLANANSQEDKVTLLIGVDLGLLYISSAKSIKVVTDDQVTDGCWQSPNSAKEAVEVELMRSGFSIVGQDDPGTTIRLTALGYEDTSNRCAVFLRFIIHVPFFDNRKRENYHLISLLERQIETSGGFHLTGPNPDFSPARRAAMVFAAR